MCNLNWSRHNESNDTRLELSREHTRAKETQRFQSREDARLNIHRRHSVGRTSKRPPVRVYVRAHNRPSYPVENFKRSLVILNASRTDECPVGDSLYIILSQRFYLFFSRSTQCTHERALIELQTDYRGIPIPLLSRNLLLIEART